MKVLSNSAMQRLPWVFCLIGLPMVLLASVMAGNAPLPPAAISAGFVALGPAVARGLPGVRRDMIALAAMGQPMALTTALAGRDWQIDSQMVFFAVAATLVAFQAVRPLIFATQVVAGHHLSLSVLLPALVYPDGVIMDNVLRSLMHGAILATETAALVTMVLMRQAMDRELAAERDAANAAKLDAEAYAAQAADLARDAEERSKEAIRLAEETRLAQHDADAERKRVETLSEQIRSDSAEAERIKAKLRADLRSVLDALQVGLSNLSAGDLSTEIDAHFPAEYAVLADGFNAALRQLREIVQAMTTNAQTVHQ
jgi:methyl-accepting chemotaxis protein